MEICKVQNLVNAAQLVGMTSKEENHLSHGRTMEKLWHNAAKGHSWVVAYKLITKEGTVEGHDAHTSCVHLARQLAQQQTHANIITYNERQGPP